MKVERTLTLDEIYEKVKEYELVLTTEASLADALNNRVETPRIGKLAYTPRNLIRRNYQNENLNEDRDLFLETVRRTEISWKEASHILSRAVDYWQETGSLEGFTGKSGIDRKDTERVLEVLESTANIYRELEEYRVPEEKSTCVVGLYQFTELDKSVLPGNFDELDVFGEEKIGLEPFRVFDSASEVVGSTIDNVKKLGGESTAVVVHPDSIYNPLIRSHLRSEGIEFQVSRKLQDSESLRTLLGLLALGLRQERIKLKDVGPVTGKLGLFPPRVKEEEYLKKTDFSGVEGLSDILLDAAGHTFGEVVSTVKDRGLQLEPKIEKTLKELGLWSENVTRSRINDLQYYLDSFTVDIEESHEGLLLVNPGAVAYVDRPVVFHLGMSTKWDLSVDKRSWRDVDRARRRNVNNFKSLIQAGDRQLYMVQNKLLNREVTPSTYFNEFWPGLTSFTDGEKGEEYLLQQRIGPDGPGFESNHIEESPEEITTLSKTELNELVRCPRDYFFSCLVDSPEKDYFRKGVVFHDFAEFYLNYPEIVEDRGDELFVEMMIDRMRPIVDDGELPKLKTDFQLGIKALKSFFKDREIEGPSVEFDGYSRSDDDNYFARELDRDIERSFTEMRFLNEEIGVRGKVDLLTGNGLVDYKTGRRVSARRVVRNSNPDLYDENPDFQALLYLTHHRQTGEERKITFTFFHFLDDPGGILRGDFDLRDYLTTVTYFPWTFSEFLTKDEVYQAALSSKKRAKLLEPLGKDNFIRVMSRLDFESGDFYTKKKALKNSDRFRELCCEYLDVGRGKDLTKNQLVKASRSIFKTTLYGLRTSNYFKEDVDKFEDFLARTIEDLNEWRKTRFPVGEGNLDEVNHRDLIQAGDGR